MTIATTNKPHHRFDWLCIQRAFLYGMAFCFAFAAGGWVTSIRVQEASLPYLQKSTSQLEQVKAAAGPDPLKTVHCLRRKSDVAEGVAETAVATSEFKEVPASVLNAIHDCPAPSR